MTFDKFFGIIIFAIGLAALAVVVSKRSNTAKVLDAFLGGISRLIREAVSPVTR